MIFLVQMIGKLEKGQLAKLEIKNNMIPLTKFQFTLPSPPKQILIYDILEPTLTRSETTKTTYTTQWCWNSQEGVQGYIVILPKKLSTFIRTPARKI